MKKNILKVQVVICTMAILSLILPIKMVSGLSWCITTTILSFTFFCLITGVMMYGYRGWKIVNNKMIFGLPVSCAIFYGVLLFVFLGVLINTGTSPVDQKINSILFGWSVGLFSPLIAWFAVIRSWTAGYTEKEARFELREYGDSNLNIDEKIAYFQKLNLIRK